MPFHVEMKREKRGAPEEASLAAIVIAA